MNKILWLLMTGLLLTAAPLMAQTGTELAGPEQQAMADTLQHALENNPTNQASDWVNPDTQRSGAVVPTRTFENAQGQPCREFTTTIIIGDQEEQGYGTACRQPDGSWQLQGEPGQAGQPTTPVPPPTTSAPTTLSTSSVYLWAPPPAYYAYPFGFYGPYHIYLSFGTVFRSGRLHHGSRYLDGPTFRRRYPFRVHRRIDLGPRIIYRHRLDDEWRYRSWERQREHREYREHRNERWRNPGRRYDGHERGHSGRHGDDRYDRDRDRRRDR